MVDGGQRKYDVFLAEVANVLVANLHLSFLPTVKVFRKGTHLVVVCPELLVVGRVIATSDVTQATQSLNRWNAVLHELVTLGAPILAPLRREPLLVNDSHVMTLWRLGMPAPHARLGVLLRGLHSLSVPRELAREIPSWAVSSVEKKVVDRLRVVDGSFPNRFESIIMSRLGELTHHVPPSSLNRSVLCHGDAHAGNVIMSEGEPLFIDLDDLVFAPYELDIAPSLVATRRFPHLAPRSIPHNEGLRNEGS